ncbi:MAG: Gfo/Idh/MocA family oxidoreductase [Thaumarchaeota archaeon]|nr:Gfo/Idh/MocA family oxidoreductase [Nitrososphaerota archaeon]
MKGAREFGVGVIGYSIGKVHAHAWKGIEEYYHPSKAIPRLVAIAGRNEERTKTEAARFGFQRTYTDWRKLVKDEDVDIVDDCAPPNLHAEPMVAAAEKGKDLVCEKPMARNGKEAKTMLEVAERARVKHMMGYNYRFVSAIALAKQMIDEGLLGRIYYFKGSYLNTAVPYENPDTPGDWHHSSNTAGYGALADLGTHAIDLARYLAGEVESVSAVSRTFVKKRPEKRGSRKMVDVDVDDITVSTLSFKNGAVGMLEASWMTHGKRDFLAFEAYGSKGSVSFNLERMNELEIFLPDAGSGINGPRNVMVMGKEHPFMSHYWVNQAGGFSWEHSFINELNHFLECLVEDKSISPQGATFLDGYRNCLIMDAMVESAQTGRKVALGN